MYKILIKNNSISMSINFSLIPALLYHFLNYKQFLSLWMLAQNDGDAYLNVDLNSKHKI